MQQPDISWYIKEDDDYIQDPDYYLGSFSSKEKISLTIQVWNNRYGQKNINSINNARLVIYFDNIEDSFLFNYCTISVEDDIVNTSINELNKCVINIGELSGDPNNGLANDKNRSNYKNITISFNNIPSNLRNGLKNMFLDIEID